MGKRVGAYQCMLEKGEQRHSRATEADKATRRRNGELRNHLQGPLFAVHLFYLHPGPAALAVSVRRRGLPWAPVEDHERKLRCEVHLQQER